MNVTHREEKFKVLRMAVRVQNFHRDMKNHNLLHYFEYDPCIYNGVIKSKHLDDTGLPWWSPNQVLATIYWICSVCVCATRAVVFDCISVSGNIIAVHLGNKTLCTSYHH